MLDNNRSKFSVILPVYNARIFLRDCLDSILSQQYSEFEIIAVNDGSIDDSGAILDEYASADNRIKVIHKINQGPLLARVDAIKKANSDYCVFVDSDDLLEPNCFKVLSDEISIRDHDIFLYNYCIVNTDGVLIKKADSLFDYGRSFDNHNKEDLYKVVIESKLNSLCLKAIKTKILKKDQTLYLQYSDVFFGEDLLLSLFPITEAKTIKYLDVPLYKYRQTEESICRTLKTDKDNKSNIRKLNSLLTVYNEMSRYLPAWSKESNVFYDLFLKTYGNAFTSFFASSVVQGASYRDTISLINEFKKSDDYFKEYLDKVSSHDLGLSKKQQILRIILKNNLYFLAYVYYKVKRLTAVIMSTKK